MLSSVPETQAMRRTSNFLSILEQNLLRTMFLGSRLSSGGAHKHPEADTLMLCLIKELCCLYPALNIRLVILALHYVATHPTYNIVFELLRPKGRRVTSVNQICDYYGAEMATAVLGL